MIEGPKLPRSHDEELVIIEYRCACGTCGKEWTEQVGTTLASCPQCNSSLFMRNEHRQPLKQH